MKPDNDRGGPAPAFEGDRPASYYKSLAPFILWTTVERPVDWKARFGRSAPIEVEIGFGNGEALIRRASERPDIDHVGIEIAWASMKRALRRIDKEGLANIRVIEMDAHLAFDRMFREKSIREIRSWFPVPWPKDRHEKRRLFSTEFLRLAASRLEDGGRFQIVTDFKPLLDWTLAQAPRDVFDAAWRVCPPEHDTKYERKWQGTGQEEFYEILLTKRGHPSIPPTEDVPLFTLTVSHFEPERFEPKGQTGPITVKFIETLYDPKIKKMMVRAIVVEDRLLQDVWLKVAFEEGRWIIGMSQPTQFVPTEGVKRALELVREAL